MLTNLERAALHVVNCVTRQNVGLDLQINPQPELTRALRELVRVALAPPVSNHYWSGVLRGLYEMKVRSLTAMTAYETQYDAYQAVDKLTPDKILDELRSTEGSKNLLAN